jgi:hypothetical protein
MRGVGCMDRAVHVAWFVVGCRECQSPTPAPAPTPAPGQRLLERSFMDRASYSRQRSYSHVVALSRSFRVKRLTLAG